MNFSLLTQILTWRTRISLRAITHPLSTATVQVPPFLSQLQPIRATGRSRNLSLRRIITPPPAAHFTYRPRRTGELVGGWRDLKNRAARRRDGETSTLPSRSGTDGRHQRASSLALDGSSRHENAAERDGQRPGDTPEPPMGQQADDSKVGGGREKPT